MSQNLGASDKARGVSAAEIPAGRQESMDRSVLQEERSQRGREGVDARRVVQPHPLNVETPLEALVDHPLTPTDLSFIRNHFAIPPLDPATWRLRVDGAVRQVLDLTLAEIQSLPARELVVTLECAGNGRTGLDPVPPGVPWGYGAVSALVFTGVPLAALLEQAGLEAGAVEILFTGADRGPVEGGAVEPFARSLPVSVALHPDTLLAWAVNAHPLPAEHGFPLRLVVPRWYGMASVKWLVRITALSEPFFGYFQSQHYRYLSAGGGEPGDGEPVRLIRVRSLIGRPTAGQTLTLGPVEVRGLAWSGHGPIARVEISADDGTTWHRARLESPPSPYAPARWSWLWQPRRPGRYVLLSRAWDAAGNTQPLQPAWNRLGYANNAVQRVDVVVAGPSFR